MVGLVGRIGTAGMIGTTGLLFGCVGVCCDFALWEGMAEEGVVADVDSVSDGAVEVCGVEVSTGSGTEESPACESG